ncbi:PPOX class F420-dependent oxidoreductase [Streptomyces sp. NBC_01408]|uniref:PPOX class F420-dependent oxidoreductase n=1 Tax=Streptomyces sp. NBC_01408 TaxID=2903855 RepID=UPI00224CFF1E|nr:PPOX class F420-dependent oxidoreductase [Streptomyces sp. NBC_01408]MCX4694828.1 PPOX class F420-dependent oxidoreductase [Streptomyces sp. NBC_01408]
MAKKMTQEEWRAFVSHSTRTGKLSTVRPDGSPHIAPIWFVLDGDSFVFTTGKDTVKGRNLARDGRVALCVDDDRPPFSYVVLQGHAEITEYADDAEGMLAWATRIGGRYMGEERAAAFGRRNAVPGELLVRVPITKVISEAGVAD